MIESEIGLQNLNQILSEDKHKNIIDYVHYGHYDFCLNNNFWPFPEPYHFEYWEIIKKISKTIIKFKKIYSYSISSYRDKKYFLEFSKIHARKYIQ